MSCTSPINNLYMINNEETLKFTKSALLKAVIIMLDQHQSGIDPVLARDAAPAVQLSTERPTGFSAQQVAKANAERCSPHSCAAESPTSTSLLKE
jgi:hypothetical protein